MKVIKSIKEVYVSIEDFINFLKENNALDKFILNCIPNKAKQLTKDYFTFVNPISWVSSIFSWYDSKEGYNYWRDLSLKWEKYLHYPEISFKDIHYDE